MKEISFKLVPAPPFRLDLTAWVLRRRPDNIIDRWDGRAYGRVIVIDGVSVEVRAVQTGPPERPEITLTCRGERRVPDTAEALITKKINYMLGLDRELSGFYRMAAADPVLGPLAERFRGVKPVRFETLFETLVNAVACQQLTLTVGIMLLNRITISYGRKFGRGAETMYAFPRPEDLSRADPDDLRGLGFSRQKARALTGLATGIAEGELDLENMKRQGADEVLKSLMNIRGVGRWTAEYATLRGLGKLDVFPGDDVGGRNKLVRWLGLESGPDYVETKKILSRWDPYQGLVYFHLLLDSLEREGYIKPSWRS